MLRILHCHNCGEVILKSNNQETKIRNRIILSKGASLYAVCRGCGSEVIVPLVLDTNMIKALPVTNNPKLFIK